MTKNLYFFQQWPKFFVHIAQTLGCQRFKETLNPCLLFISQDGLIPWKNFTDSFSKLPIFDQYEQTVAAVDDFV